MRAKLIISYDGSKFCGFARQNQKTLLPSVTDVLEKRLAKCGIFSKVIGAGRTDAGVHAIRQCIVFELPEFWDSADRLKVELMRKLPSSISIKNCQIVGDDFHPRFGAKRRAYRYVISQETPSPFFADCVTYESGISYEKLSGAVRLVNGTFDFTFFKRSGGSDDICIRDIITKCYRREGLIVLYFESVSFLRSQIRLLAYFLIQIGKGNLSEEQLLEQLRCEQKHTTAPAAPNGLYLVKVSY